MFKRFDIVIIVILYSVARVYTVPFEFFTYGFTLYIAIVKRVVLTVVNAYTKLHYYDDDDYYYYCYYYYYKAFL